NTSIVSSLFPPKNNNNVGVEPLGGTTVKIMEDDVAIEPLGGSLELDDDDVEIYLQAVIIQPGSMFPVVPDQDGKNKYTNNNENNNTDNNNNNSNKNNYNNNNNNNDNKNTNKINNKTKSTLVKELKVNKKAI